MPSNMSTQPKGPTKLFTYKVSYHFKNGDFQEAAVTNAARQGNIIDALALINAGLAPTQGPVSKIIIEVGDGRDTAA